MSDSVATFLFMLLVIVLVGVGVEFGLLSLLVVIPIVIILLLFARRFDVMVDSNVFLGAVFAVAILVGIGSCFHKSENELQRTKIHTDHGDYSPTIDENGKYHNAGTGERQIEYGGSREQQEDIDFADELIREGL